MHTHVITDHDDHFIIDPITRKIRPETPAKNKLVRNDHKSERYTFEIPRYIEGHDMTQCDSVRIHYLNVASNNLESSANVYDVDDIGLLDGDSETAAFTWLVSNGATKFAGLLSFAVEFKCSTEDTVTYAWHTEIYSSISISDVIANDGAIVEELTDAFEKWKNDLELAGTNQTRRIERTGADTASSIRSLGDEYISDIRSNGNSQVNRIKATGNNIIDSIPDEYSTMYIAISAVTYLTSKGYICNKIETAMEDDTKFWCYVDGAGLPALPPGTYDRRPITLNAKVNVRIDQSIVKDIKSTRIPIDTNKKYIIVSFNDYGGSNEVVPFVAITDDKEVFRNEECYPLVMDATASSSFGYAKVLIIDGSAMPETAKQVLINSYHGEPIIFEFVTSISGEHKELESEVSAIPYFAGKGLPMAFTMQTSNNMIWSDSYTSAPILHLNEAKYELDGIGVVYFSTVASKISVRPGDKFYIKTYREVNDFQDSLVDEVSPYLVVGVGNADSSGNYEIQHDYTNEYFSKYPYFTGPVLSFEEAETKPYTYDYMIDIPSGIDYILVNSFSKDHFPVVKKLSDPNQTIIDLTGSEYDQNTWYPVTGTRIPPGGLHKIHVYSTFDDGAHPTWATNESGYTCNMEVYDKATNWGQTDEAAISTDYSWKHANKRPCGYLQMNNSSTPVALLLGGGIYHIETDYAAEWTVHTDVYTHMSETVRPAAQSKFVFNRATIFADIDGDVSGNITGTVNGHDVNQSVPADAQFTIIRQFTADMISQEVLAGAEFVNKRFPLPNIDGYIPTVAIPQRVCLHRSNGAELHLEAQYIQVSNDEDVSDYELVLFGRNTGSESYTDAAFYFDVLYIKR